MMISSQNDIFAKVEWYADSGRIFTTANQQQYQYPCDVNMLFSVDKLRKDFVKMQGILV